MFRTDIVTLTKNDLNDLLPIAESVFRRTNFITMLSEGSTFHKRALIEMLFFEMNSTSLAKWQDPNAYDEEVIDGEIIDSQVINDPNWTSDNTYWKEFKGGFQSNYYPGSNYRTSSANYLITLIFTAFSLGSLYSEYKKLKRIFAKIRDLPTTIRKGKRSKKTLRFCTKLWKKVRKKYSIPDRLYDWAEKIFEDISDLDEYIPGGVLLYVSISVITIVVFKVLSYSPVFIKKVLIFLKNVFIYSKDKVNDAVKWILKKIGLYNKSEETEIKTVKTSL